METYHEGVEVLRICLLGSAKVGKSSIIRSLMGKPFEKNVTEIYCDRYRIFVKIDKQAMILDIRDLSDYAQFPCMEKHFLEQADMYLIVFSLNDFESCRKAVEINSDLEANRYHKPVIVIGNKSDLFLGGIGNRESIERFFVTVADSSYIEISAKQDNHEKLARKIYEEKEMERGAYRTKRVNMKRKHRYLKLLRNFALKYEF